MDKLEVFGARKLNGIIHISGSKNAALPILAATILSNKKVILKNRSRILTNKRSRGGGRGRNKRGAHIVMLFFVIFCMKRLWLK